MKQPRRYAGATKLPQLVFTPDDLTFLQKALLPLELLVNTKPPSLSKIQFALETISQVQGKISHMIEQHMWGYGVTFDANEVVVLHTAIWLFLAALEHLPDAAEKQEA